MSDVTVEITRRDPGPLPGPTWTCPACRTETGRGAFAANLSVCPSCGHHARIGARERISQLVDGNSFEEHFAALRTLDPLRFTDLETYPERVREAQAVSGLTEAIVAGKASIEGVACMLAVMDFSFMGGSMGSVVGEKLWRAAESAAAWGLPLVAVCSSGGARMQEGIISLMQMAKTAIAVDLLNDARSPFISVLADPCTGGVVASFATLADICVAEPGALLSFSGPRVIRETTQEALPENFGSAERNLELGHLDAVVPRAELRSRIAAYLRLLGGGAGDEAESGAARTGVGRSAAGRGLKALRSRFGWRFTRRNAEEPRHANAVARPEDADPLPETDVGGPPLPQGAADSLSREAAQLDLQDSERLDKEQPAEAEPTEETADEGEDQTTEAEADARAGWLRSRLEEMRRLSRMPGVHLTEEMERIQARLKKLRREKRRHNAWITVSIARHQDRPRTRDYIARLVDAFEELKGDRLRADDPAIVGGIGWFEGRAVVVVGHQKGRDLNEQTQVNFGMARPEGYRKAQRLFALAERHRLPVLTFVDTPGAYPGVAAEEGGQARAIAETILAMARLSVPVVATVIGEGGSGGALALAVADRVLMQENAVYSVISPEGCAAILWRDREFAPQAAEALRPTASELLQLGVIERVVPEPRMGAHHNPDWAAVQVREALRETLAELAELAPNERKSRRRERFRKLGVFSEGGAAQALVASPLSPPALEVPPAPS